MFTFGCSECEHRIPELSNYHTRYLCIFVCSGLFWFVLTNYYNVSEFFNEYMVLIYICEIWMEDWEEGFRSTDIGLGKKNQKKPVKKQ